MAGLASFGAAQALPDDGPLWLAARLLLDGAGALFGCYLLAGLVLAVAGRLLRRGRRAGTGPGQPGTRPGQAGPSDWARP